jgi:hypothetical protein
VRLQPGDRPPLLTDPDRNIGIPTGASSHLWILDIDGDEGEASLCELEARHGAIPKTRSVVTSRGRHVWFAYPGPVPSTAARIGPGLDTRGDGGYIIVPPSIHETGHRYAWRGDPWHELATAPQWLIDAVAPGRAPITERGGDDPDTVRCRRLRSRRSRVEIATLAATCQAPQPLNRAFSLFQLVAGGGSPKPRCSPR